jgi:lipopolysaccharide transport system permease protein
MNQQLTTDLPVTVYIPESGLRTPGRLITGMLKGMFCHQARDLAWRIFVKNISAMYRQSVLGYLWVLIPPTLTSLIWIFLNKSKVVNVAETAVPYAVFAFVGNIVWQSFQLSLITAIQTVQKEKGTLTKINFCRESLLVAGFGTCLLNTVIPLVLLVPVFMYFKIPVSQTMLLAPVGVFMTLMAGYTVGVLLTPIGLLFTDIARGIPIISRFWFFITPVVYPVPRIGLGSILKYNPVTPFITVTRDWLTGQTPDPAILSAFWWLSVAVFVALFIGLIVYRLAMPIIIERMSS